MSEPNLIFCIKHLPWAQAAFVHFMNCSIGPALPLVGGSRRLILPGGDTQYLAYLCAAFNELTTNNKAIQVNPSPNEP